MVPKRLLGGRIRESDLIIPLITGAEIVVVGLDRPERIEGRPALKPHLGRYPLLCGEGFPIVSREIVESRMVIG